MRSKTAKRIMDETPQEIKKKAQDYGNKLVLYEVVKRFFKHKHKFQVRGVNRFGTPTYQVCLKCRKSFERVNKSYEKEKWQECEKILELDKQFDKNDRYIF